MSRDVCDGPVLSSDRPGARPTRVHGSVLWFSDARGYGFVLYKSIQHFVHFSQILMDGFKTLKTGQVVTFEPDCGERGPFCREVEVVS